MKKLLKKICMKGRCSGHFFFIKSREGWLVTSDTDALAVDLVIA